MRTMWHALLCCLIAGSLPAFSQQRPLLSPRDSVSLALDTNKISVNYGRPSMRGRVIMGDLVPWDKVWRTGANQATHLTTSFDMMLDGVPLPRGRYTLWTLPSQTGWKMIINKQTGQWGTAYDERQDLARFNADVEPLAAPVDTFTIRLEKTGPTSGVLRLLWEKTSVSARFEKNDHIRPISPNDSTEISVAGKRLLVRYGRPFVRGRRIWGVVVPMDSIWRTGAGRATWLVTDADLRTGNVRIPAGSYTIYSLPTEKAFTLIISRKPGGGEPAYDASRDLTRITMEEEHHAESIDPFRIWFTSAEAKTVTLHLGWADRAFVATFTLQ